MYHRHKPYGYHLSPGCHGPHQFGGFSYHGMGHTVHGATCEDAKINWMMKHHHNVHNPHPYLTSHLHKKDFMHLKAHHYPSEEEKRHRSRHFNKFDYMTSANSELNSGPIIRPTLYPNPSHHQLMKDIDDIEKHGGRHYFSDIFRHHHHHFAHGGLYISHRHILMILGALGIMGIAYLISNSRNKI
jgi:hypothetical protein